MTSDLLIPRTCDIVARALDARESAVRLADDPTVRQLDRLIANVSGARLCWQLGTLHIVSPSGGRYAVTQAGCSCPNGAKSHARACWHVALFGLLLDILETDAQSADIEAECDPPNEPPPLGGDEGDTLPARSPWYHRAAIVRQCSLYR